MNTMIIVPQEKMQPTHCIFDGIYCIPRVTPNRNTSQSANKIEYNYTRFIGFRTEFTLAASNEGFVIALSSRFVYCKTHCPHAMTDINVVGKLSCMIRDIL